MVIDSAGWEGLQEDSGAMGPWVSSWTISATRSSVRSGMGVCAASVEAGAVDGSAGRKAVRTWRV
jgi:hypothetical protein